MEIFKSAVFTSYEREQAGSRLVFGVLAQLETRKLGMSSAYSNFNLQILDITGLELRQVEIGC